MVKTHDQAPRELKRKTQEGDVKLKDVRETFCTVCVHPDLTAHQIEAETNRINPTGDSTSWKISKKEKMPNCHGRDHYLLIR